ncbi:MAG TPA: hypothetical protein VKW06_14400 [Candidatus Angelobacter sp.]|nr:hypothetical protein [Candidatus Angelobacter sp.]
MKTDHRGAGTHRKCRGIRFVALQGVLCVLFAASAFAAEIEIRLQHDDEAEQKTRDQLQRILHQYDLKKWTFTEKVLIDDQTIPHSHPVLTLHTRHLRSDDQLLSTYVHEQLHWWLDQKIDHTRAAEDELRRLYPKVPVGGSDGARDEESTYLHLIDCYLEMQADRELMGNDRTAQVMKFWAGDHYKWIYKTVMQDEVMIGEVVKKNGLEVK